MKHVSSALLLSFFVLAGTGPAKQSVAALENVFISEVAWMGTTENWRSEWIELYNPTPSSISLDGWELSGQDSNDAEPWIVPLSGSVPANSFLVLDQKFGDYLNNDGELLVLKNEGGAVDSVDARSAWPAGDNSTKHTMERKLDGSWATSLIVNGTPGAANSVWGAAEDPAPEPEPDPEPAPPPPPPPPAEEPTPAPSPEPTKEPNDTATPETVMLSELLPDPEGRDSELEFVEVYNFGDAAISLDGWKIANSRGARVTLTGTLAPNAYAAFLAGNTSLPSLKNDGDTITLIAPSGAAKERITYQNAPEGVALAKHIAEGAWDWTATETPGTANVFAAPAPKEPTAGGEEDAVREAQAPSFTAQDLSASEAEGAEDAEASEGNAEALKKAMAQDNAPPETLPASLAETGEGSLRNVLSNHPLLLGSALSLLAGGTFLALRIRAQRRRVPDFIVDDDL